MRGVIASPHYELEVEDVRPLILFFSTRFLFLPKGTFYR